MPVVFRAVLLLGHAMLLLGCGREQAPPRDLHTAPSDAEADLLRKVDLSLASAARFLVSRQSSDGAWRSETYGILRDGPTLTPHVLSTLFFLDQGGSAARVSFRKGAHFLADLVENDGTLRAGALAMPVYTAAEASWVEGMADDRRAQQAWLVLLREHQLDRSRGWSPDDREFGGWGYSVEVPMKPDPGSVASPRVESNLSATLFALGALGSAGVPARDPAYRDALAFVSRCQNFPKDGSRADPAFDDGGFFFRPGDAVGNKAGAAGQDRHGRDRFHSYGSMTADGVRALLRCGLPQDHPRVRAGRDWLERHFDATTNPGRFNADREVLRDSTYYYWCWSAAHAFTRLGLTEIERRGKRVRWAEAMADELIGRQQPDGSWVNRFMDSKEDDPLVATPTAAAAVAICRRSIATGGPR